MDFADEIGGVLEGAECKNCPWHKHCVSPIPDVLTANAAALESMSAGMGQGMIPGMGQVIQGLQENMVISCPIFAKRLRESPKLIESIRKMMQEWNQPPTAKAGEPTG